MDMSALSQWFEQWMPNAAQKNRAAQNSLITGQSAGHALGEPAATENNSGFSKILTRLMQAATSPQIESERVVEQFARGAEGDLHESVMTLEKGDISFKFIMTAKNRIIEAYKETTRMV